MNTVQSKHKNPDKYIERLKSDVKFLEGVRTSLIKEESQTYGTLSLSGYDGIERIDLHLPKSNRVNLRQNVAIECTVDKLSINNGSWNNVGLKVKAVRVRDKEGI
ncbi:hypothetical protein LCGC14_1037240 [marine sediment metagenome]|uniref:Uncharacterized protein n=1 Tax=marine sediment metagenome TaxID=412755 RepID=A0A0F9QYY8_9ZZZZ